MNRLMNFFLLAVFPVASVIAEYFLLHRNADLAFLIGKWFVFWAIGIRFLGAGLQQLIDPADAAKTRFGTGDNAVQTMLIELGYADLAIGALGTLTLFNEMWITPAAFTGGLYYGFLGFAHIMNTERPWAETMAGAIELGLFVLFTAYLATRVMTYWTFFH